MESAGVSEGNLIWQLWLKEEQRSALALAQEGAGGHIHMDNTSHQHQGEPALGLQDTGKFKTSTTSLILGLASLIL